MIETLEKIKERFKDRFDKQYYSTFQQKLEEKHQIAKRQILDEEDSVTEVNRMIAESRQRIERWDFNNNEFSLISPGLKRIYKQGRNQMVLAYKQPKNENFHEWRKLVKYHWYHIRIIQITWSNVISELANSLHDLSDYLGDDHDLAELNSLILQDDLIHGSENEKESILSLIKRRQSELRKQACTLGQKIYLEKPSDFMQRMEGYWDASR